MLVPVTIHYRESYLPTPRCRKLRYRDAEEQTEVEIKEIDPAEIRLAFVQHERNYDTETWDKDTEIYFHNGKLYVVADLDLDRINRISHDVYAHEYKWSYNDEDETRENAILAAKRKFDYILYNGKLYEETGEPRYVINTFGLGNNHGGTGMFIERFYNPNITKRNYFNALEHDKALQYMKNTAMRRGDTRYVNLYDGLNIEVLMPECVTVNPQEQHGDGDPFMNQIEEIIESTGDSLVAGLAAIALAIKR